MSVENVIKIFEMTKREAGLEQDDLLHRARNGLLNFTCFTYADYQVNWHHRVIARYLNKWVRREIKRLMIFAPPRSGKSQLVSRQLPPFIHGLYPNARIISASYSADLATDMNYACQRIIDSDAYKQLFPQSRISSDKGLKSSEGRWQRNADGYEIIGHGGSYRCAGVNGSLTGKGCDYGILDDVIKNRLEADSPTYRKRILEWYTSTMRTRLEKDGCMLIMLTRWHEDDLAGRLLALAKSDPEADQWEVLSFPAIKDIEKDPLAVDDPREMGEPLWPAKFDLANMMATKASSGTRDWNSIYQQRPTNEEGAIIKRHWWKFYDELPEGIETMMQAWDLTFKDTKSSDFVAGFVGARKGANIYIVDRVHDRLSFTETIKAFENFCAKYKQAYEKVVEEAANGAALIDTLRNKIPGIIGVRPQGTKIARVNAVSPMVEAGNVYLPNPERAPWVNEVIEEFTSFPAGAHDDQVDALTHMLMRFKQMPTTNWLPISLTGVNPFQ